MGDLEMMTYPENQFGYLRLTYSPENEVILVKANTIKTIDNENSDDQTTISFSDEHYISVNQTMEQIIEQLENIHPTIR
jgi:hypothetical protein